MRLVRLKIKNFRCYGDKEMVIPFGDFTSFIGANSAGKTAALEALEMLFSPITARREVRHTDFHLDEGERIEDKGRREFYIEAVFEFNELEEAGAGERSIPPFFESVVVEDAQSIPVLRIRLIATWEKSPQINGTVEARVVYVQCAESDPEADIDLFPASRADLSLIRVIYVPAVRNLNDQMKSIGGSLMNQFIGTIQWPDNVRQEIDSYFDSINKTFHKTVGVKALSGAIKDEWHLYSSGSKFSEADLSFNSGNLNQAVKNSSVLFSPGIETGKSEIASIGDGLRSLFYLSFAAVFVEMQERINSGSDDLLDAFDIAVPLLTILAVEEPENHVAPHLLGKVASNLISLSGKKGAQVVISSHSASIIKRVDPEQIRHFRYDAAKGCTVVTRIVLPESDCEAQKYVRCAVRAYPELYFSRLVVLCEGDSEEIVIPRIISTCSGETLDEYEISVVPLGGRHVNHFWRLLESLKIPYVTLLDLDYGRDGGGAGRIKVAMEQLGKFKPDEFKKIKCVSGDSLTEEKLCKLVSEQHPVRDILYWLRVLEKFHIYFSLPIDLDYAMLSRFKDVYTDLGEDMIGPSYLEGDGGKPGKHRVSIKDLENQGKSIPTKVVQERMQLVLKKNGDARCYKSKKHESLMVWYAYLFLGKGKPATHLRALSSILPDELVKKAPRALLRLARDILDQLA